MTTKKVLKRTERPQPLELMEMHEEISESIPELDEKSTKEFKIDEILSAKDSSSVLPSSGIVLDAHDLYPEKDNQDLTFRVEWKMKNRELTQWYLKGMSILLLILVLLSILILTKLLLGTFIYFLVIIGFVITGIKIGYTWTHRKESKEEDRGDCPES